MRPVTVFWLAGCWLAAAEVAGVEGFSQAIASSSSQVKGSSSSSSQSSQTSSSSEGSMVSNSSKSSKRVTVSEGSNATQSGYKISKKTTCSVIEKTNCDEYFVQDIDVKKEQAECINQKKNLRAKYECLGESIATFEAGYKLCNTYYQTLYQFYLASASKVLNISFTNILEDKGISEIIKKTVTESVYNQYEEIKKKINITNFNSSSKENRENFAKCFSYTIDKSESNLPIEIKVRLDNLTKINNEKNKVFLALKEVNENQTKQITDLTQTVRTLNNSLNVEKKSKLIWENAIKNKTQIKKTIDAELNTCNSNLTNENNLIVKREGHIKENEDLIKNLNRTVIEEKNKVLSKTKLIQRNIDVLENGLEKIKKNREERRKKLETLTELLKREQNCTKEMGTVNKYLENLTKSSKESIESLKGTIAKLEKEKEVDCSDYYKTNVRPLNEENTNLINQLNKTKTELDRKESIIFKLQQKIKQKEEEKSCEQGDETDSSCESQNTQIREIREKIKEMKKYTTTIRRETVLLQEVILLMKNIYTNMMDQINKNQNMYEQIIKSSKIEELLTALKQALEEVNKGSDLKSMKSKLKNLQDKLDETKTIWEETVEAQKTVIDESSKNKEDLGEKMKEVASVKSSNDLTEISKIVGEVEDMANGGGRGDGGGQGGGGGPDFGKGALEFEGSGGLLKDICDMITGKRPPNESRELKVVDQITGRTHTFRESHKLIDVINSNSKHQNTCEQRRFTSVSCFNF